MKRKVGQEIIGVSQHRLRLDTADLIRRNIARRLAKIGERISQQDYIHALVVADSKKRGI